MLWVILEYSRIHMNYLLHACMGPLGLLESVHSRSWLCYLAFVFYFFLFVGFCNFLRLSLVYFSCTTFHKRVQIYNNMTFICLHLLFIAYPTRERYNLDPKGGQRATKKLFNGLSATDLICYNNNNH